MTRIWDLAGIQDDEEVPLDSVTIISDGELTKKISVSNMQRVMVPIASDTQLGKIRVGQGLEIDEFGTLSIINTGGYVLPMATNTVLGGVKVGDNLTISSTGVLDTLHPIGVASTTSLGLVKIGNNISVNLDGVISVTFPDFSVFPDTGIKIGTTQDLTILNYNGVKPVIKSNTKGNLYFSVNDSVQGGTTEIAYVNSTISHYAGGENNPALYPVTTNNVNLGTNANVWKSLHATTIYGNLYGAASKADTLLVVNAYRSARVEAIPDTIAARSSSADLYANHFIGNLTGIADKASTLYDGTLYRSASVNATANTVAVRDVNGSLTINRLYGIAEKSDQISVRLTNNTVSYYDAAVAPLASTVAARDSNGKINASYFVGIATQAQFADLAEKYISDKEYEVGSVVVFGGSEEITVTSIKGDHRVAGVISGEPAYLMNNDSSGQPVALRGKVPVKVIGKVSKGDLLITSASPGYAMSVGGDKTWGHSVFAKSLENKTDFDYGTVMAVIL